MKNAKLLKAEEYKEKIKANSPFKPKDDHLSKTQYGTSLSKQPKGIGFDLQKGHQGLEIKELTERNLSEHTINKKSMTTNSGFFKTQELEIPKVSLIDFRKNVKLINFAKDLPRLPFPKSDPNDSHRVGKSYNINWKGVEKRQDIACLPFGKSEGRGFYVKPYPPTSTDGYYEVLEEIALEEKRALLLKKSRNRSRSPLIQTLQAQDDGEVSGKEADPLMSTAGFRTVKSKHSKKSSHQIRTMSRISHSQHGRKSDVLLKKSGYVVNFSKILPRSLSQQSLLPTFMQKGTACSRFAVEFMKGVDEDVTPPQQQYLSKKHSIALKKESENSFDHFFGDS